MRQLEKPDKTYADYLRESGESEEEIKRNVKLREGKDKLGMCHIKYNVSDKWRFNNKKLNKKKLG